jgi:hypothetical protein
MSLLKPDIRNIPTPARLSTELQQLYARGNFAEILAQMDAAKRHGGQLHCPGNMETLRE